MNIFSNIWNHPRTSAAGLLIAVVSIAGVLSQQGIGLGAAGTGTVVTWQARSPPRFWGCWPRIRAMRLASSEAQPAASRPSWARGR